MTDKLRELVERLEEVERAEREVSLGMDMDPLRTANHRYAETCKEAAAALRELIEQKPVAWMAMMNGTCVQATVNKSTAIGWRANGGEVRDLYVLPVAQPSKECAGVGDSKCNYLAHCGSVCNKCGKVHDGQRTTYLREHLGKR